MDIKLIWHAAQLAFTSVGGWIGWYLGGTDGFLIALVCFVVLDYITGVLVAGANRKLSSRIGFKGIARKFTIFLLVGAANLLDIYIIKDGSMLRTATIFFYLSNEGISLLENTTLLGLPVPEPLRKALATITNKTSGQTTPTDGAATGAGKPITPSEVRNEKTDTNQ